MKIWPLLSFFLLIGYWHSASTQDLETLKEFENYVSDRKTEDALRLGELLLKDTGSFEELDKIRLFVSLGVLHDINRLSELDVAELYLSEAEKVATTFGNDSILSRVYTYKAANYIYQSKLDEASNYYEKAIVVNRRIGAMELMVIPYINLANISHRQGIYIESINYLSEAISILKNSPNPNKRYMAAAMNNKANSHKQLEEFDQAIDLIRQAIEVKSELYEEGHPSLVNSYISLSEILIDNDEPEKALKSLDYLFSLGLQNEDQLGDIYSFYGEAFSKLGQHQEAIRNHYLSIKHYQSIYGERHDWIGASFQNIGDSFLSLKEFDSAVFAYQRALRSISFSFDFESAQELPQYEQMMNRGGSINIMNSKALALEGQFESTGNSAFLRDAFNTYERAIAFIDKEWENYQRDDVLLFYGEKMSALYKSAARISYHMYEQTRDPLFLENALVLSEKRKSWLLLKSLNSAEALASNLIPEAVLNREVAFTKRIDQLENGVQRLMAKSDQEQGVDSLNSLLFSELLLFEQFQDSLKEAFPSYFQVKYQRSVPTVASMRQLLRSQDEVLLSYEVINDSLVLAMKLTEKDLSVVPIANYNSDEISNKLLESIVAKDYNSMDSLSERMYEAIILPLDLDSASSLIVIPDGTMRYVPFDMLGPNPQKMLIHSKSIRYGYSASLMLRYDLRSKKKSRKLLAIAPPFTEDLPLAQKEGQEVVSLFGGDFFTQLKSDEGQFAADLETYGVLHFATHGVINDAEPTTSYLRIGAGETETSNLYAYELYNLKLNADLVTLSACNTGVGKVYSGEGIVSMAHAFAYAGAPNIVATLWPVADQSSYQIMTSFYQYLADGIEVDFALRKAKLDYLAQADDYGRHPYYWAGIFFTGNPIEIDKSGRSWLMLAIGASLLAVFLSLFSLQFRKKS